VVVHLLPQFFQQPFLETVQVADGLLEGGRLQRAGIADDHGPDDGRLFPASLEANDTGIADERGQDGEDG